MDVSILSFSGRSDGNCHDIASVIEQTLLAEHRVTVIELSDTDVSPCRNCGYTCFYESVCPNINDDVAGIYDLICSSKLAFFIVPNYCDFPGALFFIFNERGQCFFRNDPDRLELYLSIEKKFIVVSNTEQENFRKVFKYHVQENSSPDILFLAAKEYSLISIEGGLMRSEQARQAVIDFVNGMGHLAWAERGRNDAASDDDLTIYETTRQFIDISKIHFNGSVLDIGGGGEGIISRHSGSKVVSIDIRKEELEETPDIGLKIVMNACNLGFLDKSFENVTCFFSLLYMDECEIREFLKEAYRVLKSDGELWIWDITIPLKAEADVFVAQISVQISDESVVSAGYGIRWMRRQSVDTIRGLCEEAGFVSREEYFFDQSFMLHLNKQ